MQRKTIVLIILVVLLFFAVRDVIYTRMPMFEESYHSLDRMDIWSMFEEESQEPIGISEKELSAKAEKIRELAVYNPYGKLTVHGTDGDSIEVKVRITNYNVDEKLIEQIEVKNNRRGKKLFVYIDLGNITPGKDKVKIDLVVTAPKEMNLDLDSFSYLEVGDIIGNLHLRNTGTSMIFNIEGKIELGQRSGAVQLRKINGDIKVSGFSGDIWAKDITGNVFFFTSHGRVELEDISGWVDGTTTFARINAKNIGGKVNFRNHFGTIVLDQIKGDIRAKTQYGEIIIYNLVSDLKATNNHGAIKIMSDYNHKISANAYMGDIEHNFADDVKTKKKWTKTLSTTVGEGDFKIDVETRYGSIFIKESVDQSK